LSYSDIPFQFSLWTLDHLQAGRPKDLQVLPELEALRELDEGES
jgi:hypothetical protein